MQIFSDVGQAVSDYMTFQKMEKGLISVTKPVSQMSITVYLLEVGSSMISLVNTLKWLYKSYLKMLIQYDLPTKKTPNNIHECSA